MKTLEWWMSRGYIFSPEISFVLYNHNMSEATIQIVDDLKKFPNSEIIVLDDGSMHNHTRAILDYLNGMNEFVVHANDLFDVVMLNRTISFARGEYVVVVQDDDFYKGEAWVKNALRLFEKDPKMAIVGGRDRVSVSGEGEIEVGRYGPFQYAQIINAAPMWIRRSIFLELGGFDLDFVPMFWHEGALCIKAWLNGYHVGWHRSGVQVCAVETTERRAAKLRLKHGAGSKNFALLIQKYGAVLDDVQGMVDRKNEDKLSSRDA